MIPRKEEENDSNDELYFFIDYENELAHDDDELYHVLYGSKQNWEDCELICSFLDESDALDYVDWKNMNLDIIHEVFSDSREDDNEYRELYDDEDPWYGD